MHDGQINIILGRRSKEYIDKYRSLDPGFSRLGEFIEATRVPNASAVITYLFEMKLAIAKAKSVPQILEAFRLPPIAAESGADFSRQTSNPLDPYYWQQRKIWRETASLELPLQLRQAMNREINDTLVKFFQLNPTTDEVIKFRQGLFNLPSRRDRDLSVATDREILKKGRDATKTPDEYLKLYYETIPSSNQRKRMENINIRKSLDRFFGFDPPHF